MDSCVGVEQIKPFIITSSRWGDTPYVTVWWLFLWRRWCASYGQSRSRYFSSFCDFYLKLSVLLRCARSSIKFAIAVTHTLAVSSSRQEDTWPRPSEHSRESVFRYEDLDGSPELGGVRVNPTNIWTMTWSRNVSVCPRWEGVDTLAGTGRRVMVFGPCSGWGREEDDVDTGN